MTCDDGKFHTVDSSEASFEMAGALGFALAFEQAGPVVLEPIDRVEVNCPARFQGDVLGDLNSRRGRVLSARATPTARRRSSRSVPRASSGTMRRSSAS